MILTTTMAIDAQDISTLSPVNSITTCVTGVGAAGWFFSETVTRQMTWADLQRNCSTYPQYLYKSDFPDMFMLSGGELEMHTPLNTNKKRLTECKIHVIHSKY